MTWVTTLACGQALDDFDLDAEVSQTDGGVDDPDAGLESDGGMEGSDVPREPPPRWPVFPVPNPVDFGYAAVGSTISRTVFLRNRGDSSDVVSLLGISGPGFEIVTDRTGPIEPKQVLPMIDVRFDADGPGAREGSLTLELCEGGCISEVPLIGRGLSESDGFVCDPSVTIVVESSQCMTETFHCHNAGGSAAQVLDVDLIDGPGFENALVEPAVLPHVVSPRAPFDFRVETCVPPGGSAQGYWNLTIDDGSGPRILSIEVQIITIDLRDGCRLQTYTPVNFGRVPVGKTVTRSIDVNGTSDGCRLDPVLDDGAAGFEVLSQPFMLVNAGTIDVSFTPLGEGESTDVLRPHPAYRVDLTGIGVTSDFSAPYAVSSRSEEFEFFTGNELPWEGGPGDGRATVAIPFPFEFVGSPKTELYVSANGFVSFEPLAGSTLVNSNLPDPTGPNSIIAWWWDDLGSRSQDGVWIVEGTAPNRVLRVRLNGGSPFGEVRLFEADSAFEIHYDDRVLIQGGVEPGSPEGAFSASAGWEGPDGLVGTDILGCSPNCTGFERPSNVVYRFTP